ncbi:MAG: restriction endonuclease subunit R [Anaerolineaceae bacterium 4572_78]|nr:MAG: restriction endonuclease subunit R [Anaerolineaceae bacterium 4572_78]
MNETITARNVTLHDLKQKFQLQQVENGQFFTEWQEDLPTVTAYEKQSLDKIRINHMSLIEYPPLLEQTVQMTVLGPLLVLADFFLAPFSMRKEVSISISDEDETITIEGRIDVLVLKENLWVLVIESKRASLALTVGFAQLLSYMLATPNVQKPCFGLITNGSSFAFIKLVHGNRPQYAMSRIYDMHNPGNELYHVFAILKRLRILFLKDRG